MSREVFRLSEHPQQPLVTVAESNDHSLVAVGASWFESAFEVAFGNSIEEVCRRFSDDLRAVLVAYENEDAGAIGAEGLVELVRGVQCRLSVASEWAERIEEMKQHREAAQ